MKGGGGPAPFLVKTHEMVEAAETDQVISWGEKGSSFVVWKPAEFADELLPANFKHSNFSSFVRQLNTYGFRKVVPDRWEFANDNFQRGQPELLSEIKRRKAPVVQVLGTGKLVAGVGGQISSMSNSGEGNSSSSAATTARPDQQQLLELSCENEKLKEDNKLLSSELALAKKQCQELLTSLSKYVDVGRLNQSIVMEEAMVVEEEGDVNDDDDDKEEFLKIFGVIMKKCGVLKNKKRKKNRCEASLMAITHTTGSHKVCN